MSEANRGDIAFGIEVFASHEQAKLKNEMVVLFTAGSSRSVSHDDVGSRYTSCWGG
jgi:hypothetical protein